MPFLVCCGRRFSNDGPCASTAVATMTSASSDIWAKSSRAPKKLLVCSEMAVIARSSLMSHSESAIRKERGLLQISFFLGGGSKFCPSSSGKQGKR